MKKIIVILKLIICIVISANEDSINNEKYNFELKKIVFKEIDIEIDSKEKKEYEYKSMGDIYLLGNFYEYYFVFYENIENYKEKLKKEINIPDEVGINIEIGKNFKIIYIITYKWEYRF